MIFFDNVVALLLSSQKVTKRNIDEKNIKKNNLVNALICLSHCLIATFANGSIGQEGKQINGAKEERAWPVEHIAHCEECQVGRFV